MSSDTGAQIKLSVDATGVETGINKAKRSLNDLGATAQTAGKQAADGVAKVGDTTAAAASKTDRATQTIIGSIQRRAAALEAAGKSESAFFTSLAQQRGISTEVLKPYLDQLDAVSIRTKAAKQETVDFAKATTSLGASSFSKSLAGATTSPGATGFGAQAEALTKVAEGATKAGAAVAAAGLNNQALGKSAKLTAHEAQQLSFQLNDLFVQIASGQSPITALIQQGSQLSGTFGGIGGSLRAITSLLTVGRIAFAGIAAAAAAVGVAMFQGSEQAKDFQRSLQLTGNAAGLTAGGFDQAAKNVAEFGKTSIGTSKEILQALVDTGRFGSRSIEPVATAIATLAEASGQSAVDVVKDFRNMRDGVAKWAEEKNKQYNFLTPQVLAHIRSLEAQGRGEEAAVVAAKALNTALTERQRPLGSIESLLKSGKQLWSEYWDAALAIGRPESLEEKLAKVREQLEAANRRAKLPAFSSAPAGIAGQSFEDLRGREEDLARQAFREREVAARAADQIARDQEGVKKQSESYQSALTSVAAAGIKDRLAAAQLGADQERAALERSYEGRLISLQGYVKARYSIEGEALRQQEAALNAEIALEQKRKPGTPEETLAQQARVIDLESRRYAIRADQLKLEEQARKGELQPESGAARLASDIASIQRASQALIGIYANQDRLLEASRASGLLADEEYYQRKRELITTTASIEDAALQQELRRNEERKKLASGGPEAVNIQREIADAEARIARIRDDSATRLELLTRQEVDSANQRRLAILSLRQASQEYFDSVERQQQRDLGGIGQGAQRRDISNAIGQIEDRYAGQRREIENQKAQIELVRALTDAEKAEFEKRLSVIGEFQSKSIASYTQYYEKLKTLQGDATLGAKEALQNYFDESQKFGKQTEGVVTKALAGIEDALVEFSTTGKLTFKSLANSIIADLIRIEYRRAIGGIVGQATGQGSGGGESVWSSLLSAAGSYIAGQYGGGGSTTTTGDFSRMDRGQRAIGGPVSAGGLFRINERGAGEILESGGRQYLMAGRDGVVKPAAGAGGRPPANVTINMPVLPNATRETAAQYATMAARAAGRALGRGDA